MKTQISRDAFRAGRRDSSVYQQQGRMLTDADWNAGRRSVECHQTQVSQEAIDRVIPAMRYMERGDSAVPDGARSSRE